MHKEEQQNTSRPTLLTFVDVLRKPDADLSKRFRPLQFIIDRKFFDARAVLGARGWTSKSDNVRSKFCDFKWSNSKNVDTANPLPYQILNHFDGASSLALKSKFSWRVRAAELCFKHDAGFAAATFPSDGEAAYTPWYPLCYNLDHPCDAFCFLASAALLMARTVVVAAAAARSGAESNAVVVAAEALCAACGERESHELLDVAAAPIAALLRHGDSAEALLKRAGLEPPAAAAAGTADAWNWKSLNEARGLWIVKPGNRARGEGIFLTDALRSVWRGGDDVPPEGAEAPPSLAAAFERRRRQASKATRRGAPTGTYDPELKSNLVVQQYVERPLLIRKKKFDMRQWVLVSSVNPLEVWFLDECYLRFCSVDYKMRARGAAPTEDERYIHLSNNSVQKHCPQCVHCFLLTLHCFLLTSACCGCLFAARRPSLRLSATIAYNRVRVRVRHAYARIHPLPPPLRRYKSGELAGVLDGFGGLMWPSQKFETYLREEHPCRDPLAWAKIQARMAAVATAVVTSAQPLMTPRRGSFELLGFDFMLDADLKVWLLEVNSSPDCSHATPVLTRICDHAHRHLFHLMLGASDAKGAAMEGPAAGEGAAGAVTTSADDDGDAAATASEPPALPPTPPGADATPYDFVAAAAASGDGTGADASGPRWRLVHQAGAALDDAEMARRKSAMDREWFDSEWQRQCGGTEGSAAAAEGPSERGGGSSVSGKLEQVIAELFPGAGKTTVVAAAVVAAKSAEGAAPDADSSDEEL